MRRNTSLGTLLAAVLLPLVASAADDPGSTPPDWQRFRCEECGFSVEMPGEPEISETHTKSVIGTVTNRIFTSWRQDEKFTVDYSKLPHFAVEFTGSDEIYAHAKGALLAKTLGRTVSYGRTTLRGIEGRSLVYDVPPEAGKPKLRGRATLFLVGAHLYVIDATLPIGTADAIAQRFLESVRFE